jgi:hypothetical protein
MFFDTSYSELPKRA